MKKLIARLIPLILLFSLCLGLFSGCGDKTPGSSPDGSSPAGSAPESQAPQTGSAAVNENGYYFHEGHISRVEYPMSQDSVDWAVHVFQSVKDMYLPDRDSGIYFYMVPDKNLLLAPEAGVDCLDYAAFYETVHAQLGWMEIIEPDGLLSLEDYYKSDSHWRQECIVDVALQLASAMGVSLPAEYDTLTAIEDFKGAYHKQFPEDVPTEDMKYLQNEIMEGFVVRDLISGKRMELYNMSMAGGSDPYGMFLSGAMGLISIENPAAENDRELIIFRDSFGSAIAPLLAQGYAKTTVVDLRYISAAFLEKFLSFGDQDVLFLHSTLLMNSSSGLKK